MIKECTGSDIDCLDDNVICNGVCEGGISICDQGDNEGFCSGECGECGQTNIC